jgi:arylsulfatase
VGVDRTLVSSNDKLPPGKHSIVLTFKYEGGGIGKGGLTTLSVDGKKVAEQKLARTIPFRVSADETLDIGKDTGTPVSEDYHVPFRFTGTLNKVVINLGEAALTPQEQKELDQQEAQTSSSINRASRHRMDWFESAPRARAHVCGQIGDALLM